MPERCVHRWILETPNGAMVHAHCKHCHQEREFPAAGPTGPWQIENGRRAKDLVPAEELEAV